jgi:pimeloyl-ACP methyl ester carboxylesterase
MATTAGALLGVAGVRICSRVEVTMKSYSILALLALGAAACTEQVATTQSPVADETETEAVATTAEELHTGPEIHSVHLSTGVRLSYLEQGRESGDPVIFLHGYTDSHHSFDLDLPKLPRRYHAFALDQRGHGDSEKPACCYRQIDFANDVVAFMDALHIHKATVVGHSMGSFIAQKVALIAPSRVEKLVLIGSAADPANQAVLDFQSVVDTLTDPIDPAFVRDFQASTFFSHIPPSFLDTAVEESLKVPATVWRQALDGLVAENHTAQLPDIHTHTLIFWGDQDTFFSASDQTALESALPHATLLVYLQTGHGLHVERPHRFVNDLKSFLH